MKTSIAWRGGSSMEDRQYDPTLCVRMDYHGIREPRKMSHGILVVVVVRHLNVLTKFELKS